MDNKNETLNRVEILRQEIEDTKTKQNQVEITIQKLKNLQDDNRDNDVIRDELSKSITKLNIQREFLEQIKDDDTQHLENYDLTSNITLRKQKQNGMV